jgi:transcriptional accessory protein Tex/SPT6
MICRSPIIPLFRYPVTHISLSPPMSQDQQNQHRIAQALNIAPQQVLATAQLFEEGATVPFISRYRKELTGSLDEVQVAAIRDQLAGLAALAKRRKTMLESLATRELLSAELEKGLQQAKDLTTLEDIFLPYKQKRKTKASMAKEKGLDYSVGKQFFKANGKAVLSAATDGFIKVIADNKTRKILGVHIIGREATELIHEFVVAKRMGISVDDVAGTIHAHPTLSETAIDACKSVFGKPIHG